MIICTKCKCRPRRNDKDRYCLECRYEYNRIWKAKKRHGGALSFYCPRGPVVPKETISAIISRKHGKDTK